MPRFQIAPPSRLDVWAAREILSRLRLDPNSPPDFHTLRASQVEEVLNEADYRRYRKPKNAPGSRGRMFYQYVTRTAAGKDS